MHRRTNCLGLRAACCHPSRIAPLTNSCWARSCARTYCCRQLQELPGRHSGAANCSRCASCSRPHRCLRRRAPNMNSTSRRVRRYSRSHTAASRCLRSCRSNSDSRCWEKPNSDCWRCSHRGCCKRSKARNGTCWANCCSDFRCSCHRLNGWVRCNALHRRHSRHHHGSHHHHRRRENHRLRHHHGRLHHVGQTQEPVSPSARVPRSLPRMLSKRRTSF